MAVSKTVGWGSSPYSPVNTIWVSRIVAIAWDCKSHSFGIRWFESNFTHQSIWDSSSTGRTLCFQLWVDGSSPSYPTDRLPYVEVPIEGWSNDGKKKVPRMFFGIRTKPSIESEMVCVVVPHKALEETVRTMRVSSQNREKPHIMSK